MKGLIKTMLILGAVLLALPARADNAGQFTEMEGTVTVKRAGDGDKVTAAVGVQVFQGDEVTTERSSKATLLFNDGSVLRLGPSTSLKIDKLVYEEEEGIVQAVYDVAVGTVMSIVGSLFGGDDSEYEVKTPTSVSGVRGTSFIINVTYDPATGEPTTKLVGVEGTATFQGNQGGEQYQVGSKQYSEAGADGYAKPPANMTAEEFQALLDSVNVSFRSLDKRAEGMRQGGSNKAPDQEEDTFKQMELSLIGNPEDQANQKDNPASFIYQEPPQATELTLSVVVVP